MALESLRPSSTCPAGTSPDRTAGGATARRPRRTASTGPRAEIFAFVMGDSSEWTFQESYEGRSPRSSRGLLLEAERDAPARGRVDGRLHGVETADRLQELADPLHIAEAGDIVDGEAAADRELGEEGLE